VNEFSEIRSLVLTPTKAHNQFMPALQSISSSLSTYGQSPIEFVFTDSPRHDKFELERNIPSLLEDVVPTPNPSTLETLSLPTGTSVLMLSSTYQVNTRLNSILSDIRNNEIFYVGLDVEWPVNRETGVHGHVALISLTYGEEIFLIPVSSVYGATMLS
jgi:hypothetical protein